VLFFGSTSFPDLPTWIFLCGFDWFRLLNGLENNSFSSSARSDNFYKNLSITSVQVPTDLQYLQPRYLHFYWLPVIRLVLFALL